MNSLWKTLLITLLLLLPAAGCGAETAKRTPQGRIVSLVSEYRSCDGFEVIRFGGLALTALRQAVRLSDDIDREDTRMALALMKGIRKVVVVDYEDAEDATRRRFTRRLDKLLDESDLLLEARDGSDSVRIFGVTDGDGSVLRDLVVHAPGSSTLVCLFGSLPVETLAKLTGDGK